MPSRRSFLLSVSVGAHVVALIAIFVASLMATGTLPTPLDRLAFDIDQTVRVMDITLPPQRAPSLAARPAGRAVPLASVADAAPLEAPAAITPDTSDAVATGIESSLPRDATVDGANTMHDLGVLESAPAPPALPQTPVRASSLLVAPQKTLNVSPVYPSLARSARVEGVVILEAVIDRAGRVESATVLRSIPMLDEAALAAVRQWRFTPTLLNGVPVAIVMTVTVTFRLTP